jgi:hypothetical protein
LASSSIFARGLFATIALEGAISGDAEEGVHMLSAVNQTNRVTHPVHANHLTGQ